MSWFDEKAHFIKNKTGSLKFAHSLESSANSASNATFRNTLASSGEKREPYEANAFIMNNLKKNCPNLETARSVYIERKATTTPTITTT